jgi:hypothetical protein
MRKTRKSAVKPTIAHKSDTGAVAAIRLASSK